VNCAKGNKAAGEINLYFIVSDLIYLHHTWC